MHLHSTAEVWLRPSTTQLGIATPADPDLALGCSGWQWYIYMPEIQLTCEANPWKVSHSLSPCA